jgi:hypothetical protein
MKPIIKTILITTIISLLILPASHAWAQQPVTDSALLERINLLEKQNLDRKPGEDNFMIVGLATFGFATNKTTTTFNGESTISKTNSWDADHFEFSPLFLWRHGKKFLMEFEPSYADGTLGVNWADISYYAAPGLIIRAGYLVLPFGMYNKRLAAGWIDKLATDPVGVPDMPPLSDYGLELEGGFQAGSMKWNYDIAVSNGHQLLPDGTIQIAGLTDNNRNKTFSGRIGWLPLSNSSVEIGASYMEGKVGDAGSTYENVKSSCYALDLNLIENIRPFQLNIKGQYNWVNIGNASYSKPDNQTETYSYQNKTQSGFIQASLRPMYVNNNILKNFEIAARYGNYTTPENSLWGSTSDAYTIGLDYWMTWRTVVKFTYEGINGNNTSSLDLGAPNGQTTKSSSLFLQFAIQL